MKQVYYAVQNIVRGKDSTIVKVVSLTLGLFLSILLFARVAFELSFDKFYENADRLYMVQTAWQRETGLGEFTRYNIHPTAEVIARHFPDEVESFTTIDPFASGSLRHGKELLKAAAICADSLYFQTMGLPLLRGNGLDLALPDAVFLSESFARSVFGGEDPMGKTLTHVSWSGETPCVVRGIYADFPLNSELVHANAIFSFSSLKDSGHRLGWISGGNFEAYVRLRSGVDVKAIQEHLDAVIDHYFPNEHYGQYGAGGIKVSLLPLSECHLSRPDVRKMLSILTILGVVLLLTATLNYVLIAISSLSRRAKSVGVHKCSGAGVFNIWSMFAWETTLLLGFVLLLVAFLILNFRTRIEEMAEVPLETLFSLSNLWTPLIAVIFLFVIGSVLPGRLFATIPVTQVFRRYAEGKKRWKYPLLFVQFGGSAFLTGLLCVVIAQYHYTMNKDLGYCTERMTFSKGDFPQPENALSILRNLPYVEDASSSEVNMTWAPSPFSVNDDNGQSLFSPRVNWCAPDFFAFMGLHLRTGRFPTVPGEMLVNQEFVRQMGWTTDGVGEVVPDHGTVTGIIDRFLFVDTVEMPPFEMRVWDKPVASCIHVLLKEPVDDNLRRLNEDMKRIYPQESILFYSYEAYLKDVFRTKRIFRDTALLATLAILAITLMGLIGYTNDEVRRRSKEIAIRKIHGSEISGILGLLSREVLWIAVPAVLIGIIGSAYAGNLWQSQFQDIYIISPMIYVGCGLGILCFVGGTVIFRSWHVANENPVKSIQNE